MGAAIGLREDFGSAELRGLARAVKDANQARRLLALAVIYDGGRRTDAQRAQNLRILGHRRAGSGVFTQPRPDADIRSTVSETYHPQFQPHRLHRHTLPKLPSVLPSFWAFGPKGYLFPRDLSTDRTNAIHPDRKGEVI